MTLIQASSNLRPEDEQHPRADAFSSPGLLVIVSCTEKGCSETVWRLLHGTERRKVRDQALHHAEVYHPNLSLRARSLFADRIAILVEKARGGGP